MIVFGVYAALLTAAAMSDLWRLRIPNALVVGVVALFFVAGLSELTVVAWWSHVGASALALLASLPLFHFRIVAAGDTKLFAATSLWMGWELTLHHLVYTAALGLPLVILVFLVRYLSTMFVTLSKSRVELPPGLRLSRSIPYGIAIAASAMVLAYRCPPHLWAF